MTDDLRRGAVFAVAAAAAFAVTGACIKTAAAHAPNEMVVFFRNAVSVLALLPWLYNVRLRGLRTRRLGGHFLRAAFGTSAMYCFFYAIRELNLAEAVLLNYSAPLFIPFIAWFWIKEPPPLAVLPAVTLGLLGIGLIVKPAGTTLVSFPALVGAASGVLAASAMVGIRRIADTEPVPRIVFYFSVMGSLISAVPLLWAWQTPSFRTLAAMVGAGLSATAGQLCLTTAYASAPAARVGAFTYTSVVFAALIGWAVWGERLDIRAVLGALIVIATCVVASWQQRRPRDV